jgi:hypothetical protein
MGAHLVRTFGVLALAGSLLLPWLGVGAQENTDRSSRIRTGVDLIKLGCGTGQTEKKTQVSGTANGGISVKRLFGVEAGATVNYSKTEAQGLISALQKELSVEAIQLSEKQIDYETIH